MINLDDYIRKTRDARFILALYKRSCHQVTLRYTKEALAAKRMQWVTLGKPKGTIQKSKFDTDCEKNKELLKLVDTPIISLLNTYINKRKLQYFYWQLVTRTFVLPHIQFLRDRFLKTISRDSVLYFRSAHISCNCLLKGDMSGYLDDLNSKASS